MLALLPTKCITLFTHHFAGNYLNVSEAAVVSSIDLVDLWRVLGGAVDDVGLTVGAPADHGAVVVGDVAANRLVLLLRKVLAAPDEDTGRRICSG